MTVREATPEEFDAVMNVLDAAMLETGDVRAAIGREDVLVAVEGGTVLGALVLEGRRIDAVAVRRARRGQGIGTALVSAASDRSPVLVAEFEAHNRPFYASLGFDVERIGDGRLRGTRRSK